MLFFRDTLVEVKQLFEEFESGWAVEDFIEFSNKKVTPEQVRKVIEFVQDKVPQSMKQLFQWLGEGLTVNQILDFKNHITQEQVDEALEHVQRSLKLPPPPRLSQLSTTGTRVPASIL